MRTPALRRPVITLLSVIAGCLSIVGIVHASPGATGTFLGKIYAGDGGAAIDGYLDMPKGFTFAADGSLVIADTINNVIRTIGTSGILSTYSGTGEFGTLDATRTKAEWSEPEGIVSDGSGVFFVADTAANRIRKIQGDAVSTLAIPGLKRPHAVIVSGSTLYISDTGNGRVVSVPKTGGTPTVLASGLLTPLKLTIVGGTLYVAELDAGSVSAIDLATKSKTVIADGFTEPRALDAADGYLYLTAGPSGMFNEIWRINLTTNESVMLERRIETELLNQTSDLLIGTWGGATRLLLLQSGGSAIYSTDLSGQDLQLVAGRHRFGDEMGTGSRTLLGRPQALVRSPDGTKLYVSYAQGNKIAEFDLVTDTSRLIAGHLMDNYREGTGQFARFSDVVSLAVSPNGKTLYVVDRNSHRIRSVEIATGTTSYLTGAGIVNLINPQNPAGNIDVNLSNGYQEGGPCADTYTLAVAGCAYFNRPTGIAITKNGKVLYIADGSNHRIRKVDVETGQTSLVAGSGEKGFVNGVGAAAKFNGPYTIALSSDERTLYVVDKSNHTVRAVDLPTRRVSTLVGTGRQGYREGPFTTAVLAIPEYIAFGPDGNLYLAEAGSFRVRKLDLTRRETSLISGDGERGRKDGPGDKSEWNAPKGMIFLGDRLIITDFKNDLLRVVDLGGQVPGTDATPVSRAEGQFFAYDSTVRGGFSVSAGDVTGDGTPDVITGAGAGQTPMVRVYSKTGALQKEFLAYAAGMRTGVRVAACDLNRDGTMDIVTIPGKGAPPHVQTFNGAGQALGKGFFALNGTFRGGASLACGDIAGGGTPEIVVSALQGGGPHVTMYSPGGRLLGSFMAYDRNFRGGIEVGLADIDGNGLKEIVTIPSVGKTHVQLFSGIGRRLSPGFLAFEGTFSGGGTIAGADVNGDDTDELIVGSGPGRINEVRAFSRRGVRITVLRPYAPGMRGGLRIFGHDLDADKKDEALILPASGAAPQLRILNIL